MKNFFLHLLLLAFLGSNADNEVPFYRKLFVASVENAEVARIFDTKTSSINEQSPPLMMGFRAMCYMVLCKHTLNFFNRLSYFNKGKNLLETSLLKEPNNPELVFFRFSVQTHVPALLGYSGHIKADKDFLINYLRGTFATKNKDVDLYNNIKQYLLQCNECSKKEKELIAGW
ncbi:MAG: hypothetical protein ACXVNR_12890 [Bacteroidia bacterium]